MAHLHQHNDIELNYVERGAITYFFGRTRVSVRPDDLLLFWAALPHQLVECDDHSLMYGVTLPLAQFLRWQLPALLHKEILGGTPLLRPALDAPLDRALFARWLSDRQTAHPDDEAIMLLELEAYLRRVGRSAPRVDHGAGVPLTDSATGLSKVEHMARFIAEHHAKPLRVDQIASVVAVHPSYAMSLFRQALGVSLMTYLTQHRIAHAQQMLVLTDRSILEIAIEVGFTSPSRFYRAFKSICGTSPHQYRMALRVNQPASV